MNIRFFAVLLSACLLFSLFACTPPTEELPLSLFYRGETLTVGMEVDPLIARLGEDYTLQCSNSCAGVGEDRMYTYPSVRLYVFAPEKGTPVLQSVSYTDDGVQTIDGLHIGSTREEVIATLGEADETTEDQLIYRAGKTEKIFRLRDDIVRGIELR